MPRALIFDPDIDTRVELGRLCKQEGYVTAEAITMIDAVHESSFRVPDIMFVHLQAFDREIEQFLSRTDIMEGTTLFLICDQASIAMAKLGMRVGAVELFTKPLIKQQIRQAMRDLAPDIDIGVHTTQRLGSLVATSDEMREAFDVVTTAAKAQANLLLQGESGTGKENLAKESCTNDETFIAVSCAGLARGEPLPQADAGKTCYFFDELLELEQDGQLLLENVLKRRENGASIRVIGSTAGDLQASGEGQLRDDLYYQLAQIMVHLPPLRERPGDLQVLIEHMLSTLNEEHRTSKFFTDIALEILGNHDWPGNARELENVIFHAFILADHQLDTEHLPQTVLKPNQVQAHRNVIELEVGSSLAEAERRVIEATMQEFDNDKPMVARVLGVSLRTLYNKLKLYG